MPEAEVPPPSRRGGEEVSRASAAYADELALAAIAGEEQGRRLERARIRGLLRRRLKYAEAKRDSEEVISAGKWPYYSGHADALGSVLLHLSTPRKGPRHAR